MDDAPPLQAQMLAVGARARAAARDLAQAPSAARTAALAAMAGALRDNAAAILAANAKDIAVAREAGRAESFIDRLALNEARLEGVAAGVETIAALPDPVGEIIAEWTRPNGLNIARVRTPIGVIGMIFESRPNVAADAGALALRAGNAIILRGGADSAASVAAIVAPLRDALSQADLPADAIQAVASTDRAAVGMMLAGLDRAIDVIVPRGGKSLVERVQREARVPVFAHLEGLCHTYIHAGAKPQEAIAIAVIA
jgi:glutamate-5-semialdehyde dehydrogenase